MVGHEQQPSRSVARVEPHGPHHGPGVRVQPCPRPVGVLAHRRGQRLGVESGHVHPVEPPRGVDRAGGRDVQRPVLRGVARGPHQGGPQQVVPVGQGLEHGGQTGPVQAGGGTDEGGLVVRREGAAQFAQPVHHGGERHGAGAVVLAAGSAGPDGLGDRAQGGGRAVPEDEARGDPYARRPGPGDELHGDDAVAAEDEEVVVHADPFESEYLGDDRAERLLHRGGGGASGGQGGEVGGGQGGAVQLAVGELREPVERDDDGRDHVVGEPFGDMGPQPGRVCARRDGVGHQQFARSLLADGHHGL